MTNPVHRRYDLESLEPRLLLSADGLGVGMVHDADDNLLAKNEVVVEVVEDFRVKDSRRVDGADEDSIFGDFEAEISFGDEGAEDDLGGQDDANSGSAVLSVETVQSPGEEGRRGDMEEQVAGNDSVPVFVGEVVPDGAADEATANGLEGSGNPIPEILTETLRNANGPPADQAALVPGGERILNPALGTVELIGNQLIVHEGETLRGSWSGMFDVVVNGGRVSPGNSPGIQNVGGNYNIASGELEMEIQGAAAGGAGVTFDQLNVSGTLTLVGTGRLKITLLPLVTPYQPAVGQFYPIISAGSIVGEFENYLGTASIGLDRAFVVHYTATSVTLEVVATPTYDPVKAQIEGLINTLGEVGEKLDAAGEFAEMLPFIGEDVGSLVETVSAIQGVLLNKLNDLGLGLSIADVTDYLEGLEGTVLLGYTMHVEGIIARFGATTANPFSWEYDIYFTRTDTVTYDLGDDVAFGGTLTGAATGSVTSRFDLDFIFGKDATGLYVTLEEFKACVNLNAAPSLTMTFTSPVPAGSVSATGTAVLSACIALTPNASILTGNKIYLGNLTSLGDGSSSVITNFTWTPTASINVDLQLSLSSLTLGPGMVLSGINARLKINGSNLFVDAPDVDLDWTGGLVQLTLPGGLPTIKGSFDINTDGALTYLDVGITELRLNVGATQLLNVTGTASFVIGDSTIAGKADLTLAGGPAIANLTITGGVWHLELNTGNTAATVPYDGGTVEIPAGPYLRVEGDGTGIGFTINPTFTLLGNFVFEKSGANVLVGASDVEFDFTDGTNDLMSITEGFGGFKITTAGIAGVLGGTFAEAIPVVDVSGTFGVVLNTTGINVNETITVNGGSVIIVAPPGPYLRVTGNDALVEVLGVEMTGDFTFENRETTVGPPDRVITVGVSNLSFDFGEAAADLVTLTNGVGGFIITNTGMAGTASIGFTVDVFGLASASGTGTLKINQLPTTVTETVDILGVSVPISVPGGPYLRIDTTGTTLSILNTDVTGNFFYEQKTTVDAGEVVSVAVTNATLSLKQLGTNLMTLTGGTGYFIFSDDGMAGTASGTVTLGTALTDPGLVTGLSGTIGLSINTTDEAVDESYTLNTSTVVIDVPAGPYLKLTGDDVSFTVAVGGSLGSLVVTGDFGFEQKSTGIVRDYIKIGATDVDVDVTAVGITVQARDGEGGFVLKTTGFAGEATLGSVALTGAGGFISSITATDMVFRINTTGADVNEIVSVSSTEDVTLDFTGAYYHHYVGVGGAVTIALDGLADFSGNLSFELFDDATVDTIRIAASDVILAMGVGTGAPVVTFFNGSGGFVIKDTGIAGVATLQFQTGFVNISGTITLELNTTNAAANYSWTPPTGPPVITIALASGDYLRVCVNGNVAVGTITIPVNFVIQDNGTALTFSRKTGGSPGDIFSMAADGTISFGSYWTSLSLGSVFDFANPSPEEILTFLQRLGNWFNLLSGSSLFDVVIPFTDGVTLGEGVDWFTGFVDEFYSKLVSTEIAVPLPGATLGIGLYAGSFSVQFAGADTTVHNISFNGDYGTGQAGLEAAIDAGILAAGLNPEPYTQVLRHYR